MTNNKFPLITAVTSLPIHVNSIPCRHVCVVRVERRAIVGRIPKCKRYPKYDMVNSLRNNGQTNFCRLVAPLKKKNRGHQFSIA